MKKKLLSLTLFIYCATLTAQCFTNFISYDLKHYALKTDGTLWIKGFNTNDYFGLGNTATIPEFIQFGNDTDWTVNIAMSSSFTLAIKSNGTLWGWGVDMAVAGGIPSQIVPPPYTPPTQIGTDTNWAKVVTDGTSTLAIKTDGTLWAWGTNVGGRLGFPSVPVNSDVFILTQVGTDTDWRDAFVGASAVSCAIKTDGTLWTWGGNGIRIGYPNATVNDAYRSPHQLGNATWKTAGIGGFGQSFVFFGVKTDGTLWAWGSTGAFTGTYFFGNGQVTYSSEVPEQIGTATDWKKITTQWTTIGLKTNGTLWGWGRNTGYELGLGTGNNTNVLFPTQIGSSTDWHTIEVDKGNGSKLRAIKDDSSIYVAGYYNPSGTYNVVPTLFSPFGCDLDVAAFNTPLFTAYPNPFRDNITFEMKEQVEAFELALYNLLGQQVQAIKSNTLSYTFDTSNLPNGIYTALITVNGKQEAVKICKY